MTAKLFSPLTAIILRLSSAKLTNRGKSMLVRLIRLFVTLSVMAASSTLAADPLSYESLKSAFNDLALDERTAVQKTLQTYGFYKGGLDAKFGKGTYSGLEEYLKGRRFDFENSEELLTNVRNNFEFKKILVGEEQNKWFPHGRNVANTPIDIVEYEGRTALRIRLRMSDRGGRGDWQREGGPGHAQRIEFQPDYERTKLVNGIGYWKRLSIYIPSSFEVDNRLTLMDWKAPYTNYLHTLQIQRWGRYEQMLNFDTQANVENLQCFYVINPDGEEGGDCQGSHVVYTLADNYNKKDYSEITDKWVDIVLYDKQDGKEGELHIWINGERKLALNGNLSHFAKSIYWKGGAYRNGMNEPQATRKTQDVTLHYSHIGFSRKCTDLDLTVTECNRLKSDMEQDFNFPDDRKTVFTKDAKRVEEKMPKFGYKILERFY